MQRNGHSYFPAFDGLRGIAILPVLLLHVGVNLLPSSDLLRELTRGWYGVDLFFVLSGFLITRILLEEIERTGTLDVGRFYKRRVLRLGPAYVTMLTAVFAGAMIFDRAALARVPQVLPALATYTYNYQLAARGPHFDVLVVVWSLCVEEQFYLVWPWLLRCLRARRALWFCAGATILLCAYRTGLYALLNWGHLERPTPASAIWIYFASDTRIGVILVGCTAALLLKHPDSRRLWARLRRARWFPCLALALLCVCVFFVTGGRPSSASWRSATFGYSLGAYMVAILIVALLARPSSIVTRALSWRPLVALGKVSYGVYLFHTLVAWLLLRAAHGAGIAHAGAYSPAAFAIGAVLVLVGTWIVAWLHYRFVERRFMAMRDRPRAGSGDESERQLQPAPARVTV